MADVKSKPKPDVQSLDGIDEILGEFNKLLLEIYDRHPPIVKKCVTKPSATWITNYNPHLMIPT